ncbi:hypothetical protein D026_0686 [Vibrio parahaemolyticus 605]|nr:hypothetical protein D040_2717 [Vibrio parahaemolyticus NIHCB0603]EQM42172.1 hypothetical protein D025_4503 [Vibrio parahaemolyticus 949]ETS22371.1 hypothetical protein D033_2048 [Vibrio parahaemolyticus B-265]ETT12827.1 hypothetical protein D026_0686 [Vibrio parahaemolyticus 605]ETX24968.1 hypothetical protein D037_1394 [Vibrio parahaemolyticus IDH02640]ETX58097.1 hypothetical protein D038_1305 [Vibrio parahaemolyticus IDH02189]ETX73775.1 hypothetical protein D034_2547 [Vibrio parahaemoly
MMKALKIPSSKLVAREFAKTGNQCATTGVESASRGRRISAII